MNMNPKRSELLRSNSLDQRILVLELTQEYLIAAIGVTGEPPFAVMVGDGIVLPKIAKLDLMPRQAAPQPSSYVPLSAPSQSLSQ